MPAATRPFARAMTWSWNSRRRDRRPAAVGGRQGEQHGVGRRGDAIDEQVGGVRVWVGRDDGGGIELDHGSSFGTGRGGSTGCANLGIGVDYTLVVARAASRPRDHSASSPSKGGVLVHAIGIDIGGTKIAGAVVDEFGAIVAERARPDPGRRPAAPRGRRRHDDRVPLRGRPRPRRWASRRRASSTLRSRPSTTRRTSTGATSRSGRSSRPGSARTSSSTTTRTPRAGRSSASAPAGS